MNEREKHKEEIIKELKRWKKKIKEEGGEEKWQRTLAEVNQMQKNTQQK